MTKAKTVAPVEDVKNESKKRVRDPEAKKRAILDAALSEFAKHGYAGARVDQIALIAGVSIGTVFKVFADKKVLANAVYFDCLGRITSRIGAAFSGELKPREAFDLMWSVYADFLFREPNVLIFFEYQPNSGFIDPLNRAGLFQLRKGLATWIENLQKAGVLKEAPSELLRAIAIGSIMRVLRESIDENAALTKSKLAALNELIWEAIVAPKPRRTK